MGEPNVVIKSAMGHGFTKYILPTDGSGSISQVVVEINKDILLACYAHEWYNK